MSTITSERKRIRRVYEPLTVAATVRVVGSGGLDQVYNALINEWEPDHSAVPLCLVPEVYATATDGSWEHPRSNAKLGRVQWLANGVDITELSEWQGKYVINNDPTAEKGALAITRNLAPGNGVELVFKGVIYDERIGLNVPVQTEPVLLTCTAKSDDAYALSVEGNPAMVYDRFVDGLDEYEYEVAHGMRAASASDEASAKDGNAYMRELPIVVAKGATPITTGYDVKLYRNAMGGTLTQIDETTAAEVLEVSTARVVYDLRLMQGGEAYTLKAFVGTREIGSVSIGFARSLGAFSVHPAFGADFSADATQFSNLALASADGNALKNPARCLDILWKTETADGGVKSWQTGERCHGGLVEAGVGDTANDAWLDIWCEASHKEPLQVADDGSGNAWTDENGNPYIF